MSSDAVAERHNDEVSKLTYFLQGVCASAIAFALHETSDRPPDLSLLFIAMSATTWAVAFAGGVVHCHSVQAALKASLALRMINKGEASEKFRTRADAQWEAANAKGRIAYQALVWGLLLGALLYAVGQGFHVLRPNATKPSLANDGRYVELPTTLSDQQMKALEKVGLASETQRSNASAKEAH